VRGFYNPPGFLSQTRNIKKRLIFIVAEKFMQFNMSKITSQKCRLCHCLKRSLDWHCQTRQKFKASFRALNFSLIYSPALVKPTFSYKTTNLACELMAVLCNMRVVVRKLVTETGYVHRKGAET
jgi:hypothetical protein